MLASVIMSVTRASLRSGLGQPASHGAGRHAVPVHGPGGPDGGRGWPSCPAVDVQGVVVVEILDAGKRLASHVHGRTPGAVHDSVRGSPSGSRIRHIFESVLAGLDRIAAAFLLLRRSEK